MAKMGHQHRPCRLECCQNSFGHVDTEDLQSLWSFCQRLLILLRRKEKESASQGPAVLLALAVRTKAKLEVSKSELDR